MSVLTDINNATGYTPNQGVTGGALYSTSPTFLPTSSPAPAPAITTTNTSTGLTQDQIQAQQQAAAQQAGLDRLTNQASVGHNNILDAYNSAFTRLQNGREQALGQYNTQRQNTNDDNATARAGILDGVHNQLTGLQRLLGAHGAGGGSAATFLAPYAAARIGNQQTSQVNNQYGKNMASIDSAINDYNTNYENSVGDLGAQRKQQDDGLDQQILSTRAQLTNAPAGSDIYNQIDNLGRTATFTPKAVAYQDPNLAAYDYSKPTAPQVQNNPLAAGTGAFFNLLNGDPRKKAGLA